MAAHERSPLLSEPAKGSARSSSHLAPEQAGSQRQDVSSDASTADTSVDVENGLISSRKKTSHKTWSSRLVSYLRADVASTQFLTTQLMLLSFSTGIIDATTLTKYSCFSSKQTGNVVFLGLRVVQHPYVVDQEEENIFFSIGFFLLAHWAFAQLGHKYRLRRRICLLTSVAIQTVLVWIATVLACFITEEDKWPWAPIIIALLAVSHGGQIAIPMQMQRSDVNTSMVTGALLSICNDANIFALDNVNRNRRLIFGLCFFSGVVVGGIATIYETGGPLFAEPFILYAICKTLVSASFVLTPSVPPEENVERLEPRRRRRSCSPMYWIRSD